ncbi:MAG: IclR family transcriptional regulator [Peptostreptococcaceae bacterium]|nr:IclR family transcriptional regulator [Peptostreptococcaceae bacterium]
MTNINNMIDRTCAILDYLYKSDQPIGVSKLSSSLDFPKATVFRILTTLEKRGIVEKQHNTDKYKLGMVLIKYGAKVSSNLFLVDIAKPIIDNLSDKIGESISLSIEHQEYLLNIYRSSNDSSILASRLIPISALNCSAAGKFFLTTKSKEALIKYFASESCEKRTTNSIIDYYIFEKEKICILNKKLSYDNEEYEYGLFCISSPIYYKGKIVAAISISGPKTRFELKGLEMMESSLKLACETVSNLADYLEPDCLL